MGEEKPEEVLMGKRKPSPRLSQHCNNAASHQYVPTFFFYTLEIYTFAINA